MPGHRIAMPEADAVLPSAERLALPSSVTSRAYGDAPHQQLLRSAHIKLPGAQRPPSAGLPRLFVLWASFVLHRLPADRR